MVVGGSGRMKLDDEIVEVEQWRVVRVPPGTWRGYEAGPEGLEILVFGAPNLGENPRDDVEGQRDWWADQRSGGANVKVRILSGALPRPRSRRSRARSLSANSVRARSAASRLWRSRRRRSRSRSLSERRAGCAAWQPSARRRWRAQRGEAGAT